MAFDSKPTLISGLIFPVFRAMELKDFTLSVAEGPELFPEYFRRATAAERTQMNRLLLAYKVLSTLFRRGEYCMVIGCNSWEFQNATDRDIDGMEREFVAVRESVRWSATLELIPAAERCRIEEELFSGPEAYVTIEFKRARENGLPPRAEDVRRLEEYLCRCENGMYRTKGKRVSMIDRHATQIADIVSRFPLGLDQVFQQGDGEHSARSFTAIGMPELAALYRAAEAKLPIGLSLIALRKFVERDAFFDEAAAQIVRAHRTIYIRLLAYLEKHGRM
jgi:hypothetical protein